MFSSVAANKHILTVSALNRLARNILETEIGQVWLSAEMSNFVAASSGHWYFTLKDQKAQIKAAMFRTANQRIVKRPREGDHVLVRANISLYEPRGDYQLIVEHLEPEGEGQLKQQFEQLKMQLAAEGLFAQQYKKPLPEAITRVGIVTSATGAALHDVLTVLKRRNPAIEVIIYPTQVQGEAAATQLCQAIAIANQRNEVQVLIVGRGGGSLEDLWCFNDERLARSIFASRLPIISAVGHEVDVSIADFVADLRAPTPSAAAELVSRDRTSLNVAIITLRERLLKQLNSRLNDCRFQHQLMLQHLQRTHPQRKLQQQSQAIDQFSQRLDKALQAMLIRCGFQLDKLSSSLQRNSPQQGLQSSARQLSDYRHRLLQQWQSVFSRKQGQLANASHLLDTVSPLATLARGYSISFKQQQIVRSVSQLQPGDQLMTTFSDGQVSTEIKAIHPDRLQTTPDK